MMYDSCELHVHVTPTQHGVTSSIIGSISELCNCATCSHFELYVCMYLCQSLLGPGAYQVKSYAKAPHMSGGYMVCAHACVTWLHGLQVCLGVTWFA